ncbi:MAG: glycosyltransferase [Selenomonadaceae bacterium]|nr:glycosyltransferase [Selenomonadaceae bacterium]
MAEISVIVPVYNVEKYLEACVQSIWAQDFKDFEIILVEDGSTDGSLALCRRLQEDSGGRIRLLEHPKNRGPSAARNTGMDAATGKYITFVDSDDMLCPNALHILHNAAERTGVDMVYVGQYYIPVFEEGSVSRIKHLLYRSDENYPKELAFFPDDLASRLEPWLNRAISHSACGMLYRRDFFERHSLRFDEGISTMEDFWFTFRVLCLARSIVILPDRIYIYRQNPSSIMHRTPTKDRLLEDLRNVMEACRVYSEFMASLEFFQKNVPVQSLVMATGIEPYLWHFKDIYKNIPPHDLYEAIREELQPIFGKNTAFVATLFQLTSAYYAGCKQILENGPDHPGNLWLPELQEIAMRMRAGKDGHPNADA